MSDWLRIWQELPQVLDPVAFTVGSVPVYWYALFFLFGAGCTYLLAKKLFLEAGILSEEKIKDFSFSIFISALLGGKLGFLLFYWYPFVGVQNFSLPETIALPGMSFFGGALGVSFYLYKFSRKEKIHFFTLSDILVPALPIALFFGRLGNFFHVELPGRITEASWGMYFLGEATLRHPSTLYAAFLEGVILFSILLFFKRQNFVKEGSLTALFCIGYGMLRFFSEMFREPDAQIGYFGIFTFNQIFSLLFVVLGVIVFAIQNRKKEIY